MAAATVVCATTGAVPSLGAGVGAAVPDRRAMSAAESFTSARGSGSGFASRTSWRPCARPSGSPSIVAATGSTAATGAVAVAAGGGAALAAAAAAAVAAEAGVAPASATAGAAGCAEGLNASHPPMAISATMASPTQRIGDALRRPPTTTGAPGIWETVTGPWGATGRAGPA